MVLDSNVSAIVPPFDFAQPPLEESALGVVRDQLQRLGIALCGFRRRPEAPQQVGAGGMEQVIAVELAVGGERIDESERRPRAVCRGRSGGGGAGVGVPRTAVPSTGPLPV